MSYNYMVRLKPVDCYYFGGETTLGEGEAQNYYVRSNRLPQVSALVGIIRYEILRQHGLLSYDPTQAGTLEKVEQLIGSQGFSMDKGPETFGIIQKLSPLFVENQAEGRFYTPLPLDDGMKVNLPDAVCSFSASSTKALPAELEGYDPKKYDNYQYWVSGDGDKLAENKIFYSREQVGITKNGKAEDEKDAFFKLILMGLDDAFNFAFQLETSEPIAEVRQGLCALGGNRSIFRMDVTTLDEQKEPEDFCTYFRSLKREGRLLLLGDAYLTDQERDELPFFWGESTCNRYIVTPHNTGHHWKKPAKTAKLYYLLARGGVIYGAQRGQLQSSRLCNVGLNIFI